MPTYEYRCPDGHPFERFYRKISDATVEVTCPTCGKVATRMMSAGAGFAFKGSGFYLTDYGKNAHRGLGKADAAAEAGSSSKDTGAGSSDSSKSESGSTPKESSAGGDAKPSAPTSESKPQSPAKSASESKPSPSSGSTPSKDK